MLVVRATKQLLDRLGPPTLQPEETSTTLLGDWYATALSWKPQVALLVSEATLLPVLMPLAPAATLVTRFPEQLALVLAAHGVRGPVIGDELDRMRDARLAKTASRSVVGIMNEFTFITEMSREPTRSRNLIGLAVSLAATPCGPLFKRQVSPDRELHALIGSSYPR